MCFNVFVIFDIDFNNTIRSPDFNDILAHVDINSARLNGFLSKRRDTLLIGYAEGTQVIRFYKNVQDRFLKDQKVN